MNRRARRAATAGVVAGPLAGMSLLLAACAGPDPDAGTLRAEDVEPRSVAMSDAGALPDVVESTWRIGTTMLAAAPAGENVVVSPSSLAVALAMLADGARTHSLAELETVLGASGEDRRDAFAALRSALLEYDGDPGVVQDDELPEQPVVHLAGQVVVDDEFDVERAYLDALADGFGAGTQHTDLATAEGKAVLDAWVRHHTGGLIESSAIKPNPFLRLVLQDAILVAARWDTTFSDTATSPRPFTLADGSRVEVEMMASGEWFSYAEVDGWRAARLPYVEALHADVLLPPAGTDPSAVTPELLAAVDEALDADEPEPLDLWLPTLDLTQEPLDLLDTIETLGAGSLLQPQTADLTGIAPPEVGLHVGEAWQQAVLQVDEEGTVAAAVTEIAVEAVSAQVEPEPSLHLDRPFLFSLSHTETSWPLFLAAVQDPRH